MTPEQFENTVNFILGCQARTDQTLERITKKNEETSDLVRETAARNQESSLRIDELGDKVDKLTEDVHELRAACRDLLDASINQSKRLSRLEDR